MAIITIEQARKHLRLPWLADESDLELTKAAAEEILLAYLARPDDAVWTATIESWTGSPAVPAPRAVQLAALMQLAYLYTNRGDERVQQVVGAVSPDAAAMLLASGYRDPVVR